ncbi:hypothetical protein [Nocardia sp. NPDC059691]|uniref:hypothetical protein n=1 Tax=Nocardia sp. NPDC059691 TaxID=3346908 RepID=UPI00369FE2F1
MFALFITPAISSPEEADPPPFNTRCDLTRHASEVCAEYAPGQRELSANLTACPLPLPSDFRNSRDRAHLDRRLI